MLTINARREPRYMYTNFGDETRKSFRVLSIDIDSYAVALEIMSSTLNVNDIGCHSIHIGRHTSIGCGVNMICDMTHDYCSLYQGVISEFTDADACRGGGGQILKRVRRKGEILIGNDVWIGNGATILAGIRIGDGAVVAANSNVVKDVPPYAIVGGNPAKIIRYRFPADIIQKLRRIAWWSWDSEQLIARKADMLGEVADFANKYDALPSLLHRKSGAYVTRINKELPLFVHFMDFEDEYPLYPNVLAAFLEKFPNMEAELLLCYEASKEENVAKMEGVSALLSKLKSVRAAVNIKGYQFGEEEQIISEADFLITNRDGGTLFRVALADRYRVPVLSGVDIPLFYKEHLEEYGNPVFFL